MADDISEASWGGGRLVDQGFLAPADTKAFRWATEGKSALLMADFGATVRENLVYAPLNSVVDVLAKF